MVGKKRRGVGMSTAVLLLSLAAPARADMLFGYHLSARAGTTEAGPIDREMASGGTGLADVSAYYQAEGGLDFTGTSDAFAEFFSGIFNRPSLRLRANATFDGPPIIGFSAGADASFTDTLIVTAAKGGALNLSIVVQFEGSVSPGIGSIAGFRINIGSDYIFEQDFGRVSETPTVVVPLVPLGGNRYSASYLIAASLAVVAGPEGKISSADFSNTILVLGFEARDAIGNPVDVAIESASGIQYNVLTKAVPEPSSLVLASVGLVGAAAFGLRARAGGRGKVFVPRSGSSA